MYKILSNIKQIFSTKPAYPIEIFFRYSIENISYKYKKIMYFLSVIYSHNNINLNNFFK